jgi:hypothetical protein
MALLGHNVRQRRNSEPEEVMVVQTLRIVDRYGKRKELPKAQVGLVFFSEKSDAQRIKF